MSQVDINTFHNQMQGSKKRPRIQMACDHCRKKKVKCNGSLPCQNCSNVDECIYSAHKERKRRSKNSPASESETSKTKTIEVLSNRLNSLESLLSNLVSRLDGSKPSSATDTSQKNLKPVTSHSSNSSSDSESTLNPTPPSSTEEKHHDDRVAIRNKAGDGETEKLSKFSSLRIKKRPTSRHIQVRKCQSYFCIISEKTKAWIKSRLRPQDLKLVFSIEKLPMLLNSSPSSSAKAWSNVPSNSKHEILPRNGTKSQKQSPAIAAAASAEPGTCDFPSDSNLVYGFLNTYYKTIPNANLVVDHGIIIALFDRYYSGQNQFSAGDQAGVKQDKALFKYSELLIMNIALALAIENKSDVWNKFTELYTLEDLNTLQEECFNNAVYFYERVNIVCEGLITIQAIVLLYTFADVHYSTDFYINNMLTSVAIRFAQELGLNRVESYDEMSEEEADIGRKLWWYCHCLDMDSCYKTGKPPLINLQDVSSLTDMDVESPIGSIDNHEELVEVCFDQGAHVYSCHYTLLLNRVRNKSYYELFSASSQRKLSTSFDVLVKSIEMMNSDMMELANKMHPRMRPTFLNKPCHTNELSPDFDKLYLSNKEFMDETNAMFKIQFFCHLMIINRVPLLVNFSDKIKISSAGRKSLECARTILLIVLAVDSKKVSKINYELMEVISFIAFLTLLTTHLQNLADDQIPEDFDLLAKFSMNVFSKGTESFNGESWAKLRALDCKRVFMILVIRISLKILAGAYDAENNVDLIEGNAEVSRHLTLCEEIYPEAFGDTISRMDSDSNTLIPNHHNSHTSMSSSTGSSSAGWSSTNISTPVNNLKKDIFGNHFSPSSTLTHNNPISPYSQNLLDGVSADFNSEILNGASEVDQSQFANQHFSNVATEFQIEDLINDDAISNLLFSQAYNFPNSLFDGVNS
ncbi:hypothetical protein CLIB1423_03S00980 [[Candida] railenensis]|uniref:Zn(2)-C6 fungal-type domain-containing protein n=1 Tax=[Candida] railenensis TaxID=45579 RepID=A0A9P0VWP4_9ASCO|nr:hypothetical protein CLIB1423_03S00980 [[Candida] railenensis]